MTFNTPQLYKFYTRQGGVLSRQIFSEICQEFNRMVMNEIVLKGGIFNMGNNLSTLSIGRIKRNYSNRQIDWQASNKLKEELLEEGKELYDNETGEGHKWLVYFTNTWYCRFYWNKAKCKVPNKSAYRFTATRGDAGNKTKLKHMLRNDELAYLMFDKLD